MHGRGGLRRRCGVSGPVSNLGVVARWRQGLAVLSFTLALLVGTTAAHAGGTARGYDSRDAGHPLRIVAYVLHPVGVILDTLITRPAYWVGSHEPFKTLTGNTD